MSAITNKPAVNYTVGIHTNYLGVSYEGCPFENWLEAQDWALRRVADSDHPAVAVISKVGDHDKVILIDRELNAKWVTDKWAWLDTCKSCNNDHHFIDVALGICGYNF